ncbi:MAG: hypothetical protein ACI9D0_001036 [Bacteroidia bacterium]
MSTNQPKPPASYQRARRFRLLRSIRVFALGGLWAIFAITMNFATIWLGLGLFVIIAINATLDFRDAKNRPKS